MFTQVCMPTSLKWCDLRQLHTGLWQFWEKSLVSSTVYSWQFNPFHPKLIKNVNNKHWLFIATPIRTYVRLLCNQTNKTSPFISVCSHEWSQTCLCFLKNIHISGQLLVSSQRPSLVQHRHHWPVGQTLDRPSNRPNDDKLKVIEITLTT